MESDSMRPWFQKDMDPFEKESAFRIAVGILGVCNLEFLYMGDVWCPCRSAPK